MRKISLLTLLALLVVACGTTAAPAPTAPDATKPPVAVTPATAAVTPATVATPLAINAPLVVQGAGDIKATVDQYRNAFGGPDNGGKPGTQPSGFRSINWDSVPDEFAAPNNLPPDFFNAAADPRARGAILTTPGTGVQVSARPGNAANIAPRFGNINPQYAGIFKTFSPEQLFSPIGSNIVDLTFAVPGAKTPALVRGFGAVYTNVRIQKTEFEYFDGDGKSLGKFPIPLSIDGLSFLGVVFPSPVVARVRIAYGTNALGPNDAGDVNVAVMDDFIYGEPQPAPQVAAPTSAASPQPPVAAATPTAAAAAANVFVLIGDTLNRDKQAAGTDQQLTVGSLDASKPGVAWATWAEKQGATQQIFVARQNGAKFEPVSASLNIHGNVVAEKPSIDFAGTDRTVPWVAWYEPSPGFGNVKQIFASRFNAASGLFVPAGQDRGSNEPSLNIHTNKTAEDPALVGGTLDPTRPPAPWVCWQEDSAHHNTVAIFVSHAVADDKALGGFKWQPVGLNRGGTDSDPEPNVDIDAEHSDGEHCSIVFAETNNAVPWVVWAERSGTSPAHIFTSRAVADAKALGGFHWQPVPNCTGPQDAAKCTLNVNPTKEAVEPFMTAGTVIAGQATVPWIVWSEVGASGKHQIFVDRLDQVSRNAFLNVGGSLNADPNSEAGQPSISFIGNVPFVAWNETVGSAPRVFVRHLASDPQTGTWVLDTPGGLALDKTRGATYPIIRALPGGKAVIIWREGDPAKEASQIVVCTNASLSSLLPRIPGLAALFQPKTC